MVKDSITVESLTIKHVEPEKKGLTLGFDAHGKSFIWVCASCKSYKNNFQRRGTMYVCINCGLPCAVQAIRGCERG